jgi:FkbM family methyltransferase
LLRKCLLLLGFSLLQSRPHGLIQILQIGAFDGQVADPLADILRLESGSAVLVEPQIIPYKALVVHYEGNPKIRVVNAAVAESDGEVVLYVPSSRESPKASLIDCHHRRFGVMAKEVHQLVVPSMSMASLFEAYQIKDVHILQIDTEGMDYDVLNWFFDADVQPALINFEHLHLDRRELLWTNRYWWIETSKDTSAMKEFLAQP